MRKSLYVYHNDRPKASEISSPEATFVLNAISNSLDLGYVYSHCGKVSLVNGGTALRAALSRNDPNRVSTLETSRATTTRYL
jgi:hypothetical protein